ncbi:MAG: hypothetical protein AB7E79_00030 [Rhodospirillaceae bacterium]
MVYWLRMQWLRRTAALFLLAIMTAGLLAPASALARCAFQHEEPAPASAAHDHAEHALHHAPPVDGANDAQDCGGHCIVVLACAAACFGATMPAMNVVSVRREPMAFDLLAQPVLTARIISPELHPPRPARL